MSGIIHITQRGYDKYIRKYIEPCAICGKWGSNDQEHYDKAHPRLMKQLEKAEKDIAEGKVYTHKEVFGMDID